ncbi:MAG: hypothetical protein QW579_04965 [Desulfurococcaceae archaeon]
MGVLLFTVERKTDPVELVLQRVLPVARDLKKARSVLRKLKREKIAYDYSTFLVEIIRNIKPYSSLSYIPSGSFANIYSALRGARISKKKLKLKKKDKFVFPFCYGVANGYIVAAEYRNILYASRSPLGDLLVEAVEEIEKKEEREERALVKKALAYVLGGLLAPSRTSLLYILMKAANTDNRLELADHIRSKLFSHQFFHYRRLVADTLYEIVDTNYLGMLTPEEIGLKKAKKVKRLFTPSNAAYVLAKMVDELVDFETYKRVLVYVAGGKGFLEEDAFRRVFEGVRVTKDEARKLIAEHPVLSLVSDFVERIKQRYDWLDSEVRRLTEL